MARGTALLFSLIAEDKASPAFLRVASAADKTAAATLRAEKNSVGAMASMSRRGAALSKGLTLPLLAVGAVGVAQASKWQKSMTLIQTAGGETAAKTAALSKGLMKLAGDTGTSLDALGEGIYTVAKAGGTKWSAVDQLKIMRAAAQGAKAENVDLGTATNALTSVMMSYHLGADKAVATQNMLIVGAGRAKTTMQDYAAALATVVPVASAAGIGFDQVAGAIATLTQHGTSAAEATQELAFTVRNLQAPNNVAVSAMNQLGIASVDVSKNLGKRGLTGTLQYIESKLPKSGLVYLNTMKQMEAGTGDLTVMQSKMTPQLRKLSEGFLKGSVSLKDYRTGYKGFGAEGAAQGSAFQNLALKVKGYNDNIKNGTPAQKTMASQLKAMFGGAVGLNTALQLGGDNLSYFKDTTKEVAAAARNAGVDVLGWAKTQGTFAVKVDKAKASLQVMAVEIGTALIPAVSKIADGASKVVHAFDGLSSGQKKVAMYSAGVLVALGPVLTLGSRMATVGRGISTAASGIGTRMATLAGASEASAARVGVAMGRVGVALGGAGIGFAIGQLTKNASTGKQALGVLASAAAGAAIGAGAGGVGALVGGLAGGIGALAAKYLGTGHAARKGTDEAKQALKEQKASASDLLETLRSVNGAYSDQYKQTLADKLRKSGALSKASAAGVDPSTVLNAALGKSADVSALGKQLADLRALTGEIGGNTGNGFTNLNVTKAQIARLEALEGIMKQLGIQTPAVRSAEQQFELLQRTLGKSIAPASLLKGGVKNLGKELAATGSSLDKTSGYGMRNNAIIGENLTLVGKQAEKSAQQGKSIGSVAVAYEGQVGSIRKTLLALHFNAAAVDTLLGKYRKIPQSVLTKIEANNKPAATKIQQAQGLINAIRQNKVPGVTANTAEARTLIAEIQTMIDRLHNKQIDITVNQSVGKTVHNAVNSLHPASGGFISGAGTGTSDSIPAMVSNGEFVVKASQTKKHLPLLHAINRGVQGYAKGGTVGGIHYTTDVGYHNAQARAAQHKNTSNADAVSSSISGIGQSYSPPFSVADVGIGRMRSTISAAIHTLNTQIGKGLASGTAAGFRRQIASLTSMANAQLATLRVKIKGSDLSALRNGLKGSVDDTRAAFAQLITDISRSGGSAGVIGKLRTAGNKLAGMQGTLASAKEYGAGIGDTLRGAYDPTKAGSIADLHAGLSGATGQNKAYASQLNTLRAKSKGNAPLTAFINQLAASGNTATLATLAGASKGELAQTTKDLGAYNSSVSAGVNAATTEKYGKDTAAMQKQITETMNAVAAVVNAQANQKVTLQVGGEDVATTVVRSKAMQTALDNLARLIK